MLYGFDIVGDDADEGPVTPNRDEHGNRDRFANATPILDRPIEVSTTDMTPEGATASLATGGTPIVRTRKPQLKLED